MSGYLPEQDPDALARLGVLLEQLEGLVAVGTQADYEELTTRETRLFMYGLQDLVTRCTAAYMDHVQAEAAVHREQRAAQEGRKTQ